MSVCVVIRKQEEALQLKELGLWTAGTWGKPLDI